MSKAIWKNTLIFSAFTVFAQVLAVLRDVVLVRVAGVGSLLDTYYMAFKIPDLLSGFYMIFLGSVVFIPLITRALKEGGDRAVANKLSEIGSFVLLVIGLMFVVIYLTLPTLAQWLVPSWSLEQQLQMVQLSRILLISQLIFPVGIIAGALSMVYGRVGFVAVSSALYNMGILLGAWLLFPVMGIYGVAVGVVLGAIMFLGVQAYPKEVRNIFKEFRFRFHFPTVKTFVETNSSRFFSVFMWQVFLLLLLYVASKYGESSISVFNIAYGIDVSLISIVGTSVSSVMLPIFARLHIDADSDGLRDSLNSSTFYTLYVSLIISYMLFLFAPNWIGALYYFSQIEPDKLFSISAIFAIFMLSLPLQNYFEILRKYLYSTEKIVAVSAMIMIFIFLFALYVLGVRIFFLNFDSVNTLAQGFLVSNILTIAIFSIIYRKSIAINYKYIFHKLFPLLISIPLSALAWYFLSTHSTLLASSNNFLFLIKNTVFIIIILTSLLYIFRDSVTRSALAKISR